MIILIATPMVLPYSKLKPSQIDFDAGKGSLVILIRIFISFPEYTFGNKRKLLIKFKVLSYEFKSSIESVQFFS